MTVSATDSREVSSGQTDPSALQALCQQLGVQARAAGRKMALVNTAAKNAWLERSAEALRHRSAELLEANAADVAAAPSFGLIAAAVDRLRLDVRRIDEIARSLLEVVALDDPIGEVVRSNRRGDGLDVTQVRVPLGVIFMIFESRPNVTVDAAALCVKSGNAVILRGGKEAFHSNRALHRVLAAELESCGLPRHAVQLVPTTDRDAVGLLLGLPEFIDLAIPRGGESLIRRVVAEARMPVMKHYQGLCTVYVDAIADLDMAQRIVLNAKVQRPGVCNAAETLLVHRGIAPAFLPKVASALRDAGVELRGDAEARSLVPEMTPARPVDWDTEFLDKIMAIRVVDSLDQAIAHISAHGSAHTDAIVTADPASAAKFVAEVDSSAVMVNASTRFNDGGQLGLGAEIGISTDKYHARGPCGLRELCSTKWIVRGGGHIRE